MSDELALSYDQAPALLREFALPLMRGEAIRVADPVSELVYWDYIGGLTARARCFATLGLELQRRARRLLVNPPLLEVRTDDLQLTVVAYTWCWLFHPLPEEKRIWARRMSSQLEATRLLLDEIPPPQDVGQALVRHLLLRHLPRLYREDVTVTFPLFWSTLEFKGTEPRWAKLPGRQGSPQRQRRRLVATSHQRPEAHELLEAILQRDPLTRLLELESLAPSATFTGTLPVLGVPSLCRLVTQRWVDGGLERIAAPLARSFVAFIDSDAEPLPQKRYLARFVYNLLLTWCALRDADALRQPWTLPAAQTRAATAAGERNPEAWAQDLLHIGAALHAMREGLGAGHITRGAPHLAGRLEAWQSSSSPDPSRAALIERRLRERLGIR